MYCHMSPPATISWNYFHPIIITKIPDKCLSGILSYTTSNIDSASLIQTLLSASEFHRIMHMLAGFTAGMEFHHALKTYRIFYSSCFSTSTIAFFCIGILQFLLLPNSTITTSSDILITTP